MPLSSGDMTKAGWQKKRDVCGAEGRRRRRGPGRFKAYFAKGAEEIPSASLADARTKPIAVNKALASVFVPWPKPTTVRRP